MSQSQVDQAIAAEVIKAWRKNRNIFEAAEPIAKVREAGRVTFLERYDLLRQLKAARMSHDDIAQTAWGVLVAAQQDGVTDLNAVAHSIAWALLHCGNCGSDPATCACDES